MGGVDGYWRNGGGFALPLELYLCLRACWGRGPGGGEVVDLLCNLFLLQTVVLNKIAGGMVRVVVRKTNREEIF